MSSAVIRREQDEAFHPPVPAVPVQQVKTQYTTAVAVQQPRVQAVVERRAIQESELLGESAFYAWGTGKDRIEGPSKKLAMILARCYGNCAVDMQPVQDTADAWIFTAAFVDLETGFSLNRQFRQSKKWTIYGKMDEARKEDIRFQIGQSKATRNVILNALPSWLVSRAMDIAKGGVRASVEALVSKYGIEKIQAEAVKVLTQMGVEESRILNTFGRKTVAALTIEDLVLLKANAAALKTGEDTIDSMFPLPTVDTKPAGGSLNDRLKPPMSDAEKLAAIEAEKAQA